MSTGPTSYRRLTEWEKRLILRLLNAAFPGRNVLLGQLESTMVRQIDANGSLELHSEATTRAAVEKRIPTEGEATDRDGTTIHYLLHVVAGRLKELEVYKDDSSRVLEHPEPEDIEVVIPGL